jgi:hypothetical protein
MDGNAAPKRAFIKKLVKLTTVAIKIFKVSDKLPTICVFGHGDLKLITPIQEDYYEIIVRTFLKTRMIRVPNLCYI